MLRIILVILSVFSAEHFVLGLPVTPGALALIGNGYNILLGNPDGDLQSGDPELQKNRHIYDFSQNYNKVSTDGKYSIPDQVEFVTREDCVPSVVTGVFEGTKSYQDQLKNYVEQFGDSSNVLAGYEFSKSAKFNSISQSTKDKQQVFFDDVTICNLGRARYTKEQAFSDRFPLSRDFVADACALPSTFELTEYMRFLDTWGTHVITQVDMGSKVVQRSRTNYKNLVKLARKLGKYHTTDGNVVSVDMEDLKQSLRMEPALFDDIVEILTVGVETKAEPVLLGLIGIDEVFSIDYWQQMDRYVSEGLCQEYAVRNLARKQLNLVQAMQVYPRWHNAELSFDPVVQSTITWPVGTYSLPMTNGLSGCPNTAFFWMTGRRYQDTQDLFPSNDWSNPCHLLGPYTRSNMQQNFCTKTESMLSDDDTTEWEAGEYCIFKKGACPVGFTEGWIKWDDQDVLNSNDMSGVLPDGVYDHNTLIYYCCREDGDPSVPILLPTDDPFFLFRKNDRCQAVHGMTVEEEWFKWDGEDDVVDLHRYSGGSHPYIDSRNDDHKLYYCYYY